MYVSYPVFCIVHQSAAFFQQVRVMAAWILIVVVGVVETVKCCDFYDRIIRLRATASF